ncbi:hypothetical protein [Acetobacter persici]|uniref:hypothetical protein n=1 Tax=Acetobacter persici TaxID=1076596 RepID=UPI001BA68B69|nr:hypothetical protein [Acetobacter persici]MBS1017302.1 hypothetical protein [Acetobacter persici]
MIKKLLYTPVYIYLFISLSATCWADSKYSFWENKINDIYKRNNSNDSIYITNFISKDQNSIPDNSSGKIKYIALLRNPINYPAWFGVPDQRGGYTEKIGFGVPYYGDGVVSLLHSQGNGSGFQLSRVDGPTFSHGANIPAGSLTYVMDTSLEGSGTGSTQHRTFDFNTVVTSRSTGSTAGLTSNLTTYGMNGASGDDTNSWTHTQIYGTNWTWAHINEMYEFRPFYCDENNLSACEVNYMYENDMGGVGPELPASAYDPSQMRRHMYWITTNHNVNNSSTPDLRWFSYKAYSLHQIITVVDATNEYMFEASIAGTSGQSMPRWTYNKGDKIIDGTIIWRNIGTYSYDIGCVFCIAGSSKSSHKERIGTVMAEYTDLIYNAIFDMSLAKFDSGVMPIFARLQKNMFIDLSANGTLQEQNNHLFGYVMPEKKMGKLEYKVSAAASSDGKSFIGFQVGDDGSVGFPNLHHSHKNKKLHYLCIDDDGEIFKSDVACVQK